MFHATADFKQSLFLMKYEEIIKDGVTDNMIISWYKQATLQATPPCIWPTPTLQPRQDIEVQ